jgi:lysozyme family protein
LGGETNWGISKRSYPELDIKNLTQQQAVEIYKKDYLGKLPQFTNERFMWKIFDISVNMGYGRATNYLELITQRDTLDGVFELCSLQMKRYVSIVIAKPSQIKFLRGWTNRAMDVGLGL